MRLFVLRHGETEWSRTRRFTGARDIALTARGQQQAEAASAALAGLTVHGVYASPLERARTSAEVIAKPHQLAVEVDARFTEMRFGEWEGLTREEAAATTPGIYEQWRRTPSLAVPPGGEGLPAVGVRVGAAMADLQARHTDQTVVLVTHAVVIRLIVLAALGLPVDRLWSVDASPGGLTEIEYRPGWVTVHRMNTLSHLDGVPA
jgi:broad specificity phosphatase PhoE